MVATNGEEWLHEGSKYEQMAISLSIPITITQANF